MLPDIKEICPMDNLIFCLNAVLPVFFMIGIGQIMILRGIIDERFAATLNSLVYNWLLPAMLFTSIYESDLKTLFDGKLVGFFAASTLAVYLLTWIAALLFLKDRSMIGSFVQICYRGNYLFMGVAVITGIFGQSGLSKAAMMAPILVALYSTLAVTVFTVMAADNHEGKLIKIASTFLSVITNRLIIAILIALPFNLLGIKIPAAFYKPIQYIAGICTPLALIGIGTALNFTNLKKTMKVAVIGSFIKTVLHPLLLLPIAVYSGFRGLELGILAAIFSAPVAVGSYAMAKSLGGDADLAANGVLLSVIMSVVSILTTFYILKSLALI